MKKRIIFVLLVLILSASGCTEQKSAAQKNIELATSLMSSGEELIEDIDSNYPTDAKNKLYASKVSYEDALEILENITTEDEEEKKIIETNIIICNYYIESIESQEHLADCYEHLSKAESYIYIEDYDKAHKELTLFSNAVSSASPNLENAKKLSYDIDMDVVPLELKPVLIYDRETMYNNLDIVSELQDLQLTMDYQITGLESYFKALDHMENKEWEQAESRFYEAGSNLTSSRDILIELQDSKYSEISISAIESASVYDDLVTISDHFALACGYMDDGKESKAQEEIELALEELE
jgi:hypothetical protein